MRRAKWAEIAELGALLSNFVSTGFAARCTIQQAVLAKPNTELALAQTAILIANALRLGQVALHAHIAFTGGSARGHV